MAKNREPEKPVESESESGESGSESESESETDQNQPQIKMLSSISAPQKSQPQSSSKPAQPSDDEDSESGSESESESDGPDPNVKPLASKPMDEPKKSTAAKIPRSKENATPVKSSGAKRPAEEKETAGKDNKRSKKKVKTEPVNSAKKPTGGSNDDPKRVLFQRLWSEDDEIVILKGMFDYSANKKSDPVANLDDFLDFIKKNLHVEVTSLQLKDKIRRLKKKYERNKSQEIEGKEKTFSKPHETKTYEWSKKVWGYENPVVATSKANGSVSAVRKTPKSPIKSVIADENRDSKEVKSIDRDIGFLVSKIVGSDNVEERILRIGAELFEGEKEVDGETEWKNLRVKEIELYLKKLDLVRAQTKLVLDVLKSTDH